MKPAAAFVALCLAASVAFAADPAEELYKKVSDAWAKAKTIHMKDLTSSAKEPGGGGVNCTADLWLGEGALMKVAGGMEVGGQKRAFSGACDGTTLVLASGGAEEMRGAAPKDLGEKSRAVLAHGGYMVYLALVHSSASFSEGGASAFKSSGEEKVGDRTATVIEYVYKFNVRGNEQACTTKLYVDKDTMQILKRVFTDPNKVAFTELYPSVEVDTAAPEGTFTVPPAPGK